MNENSGQTKRVSFLMPYIDFCFMLIIIFVGMLAIAYFEPPGKTDVEVKRAATRTDMVGRLDPLPAGIERRNRGTGESTPQGMLYPLKNPSNQQPFLRDNNNQRAYRPGEGASASQRLILVGRPSNASQRASSAGNNNSSRRQPGRGANPPGGSALRATAPPRASGTLQPQPQVDVKKLQEQIEQLKKNQRTGPEGKGETNNLYLDLRGGK